MHRLNENGVKSEVAIFAGGRFQRVREVFSEVPGVLEVVSGLGVTGSITQHIKRS